MLEHVAATQIPQGTLNQDKISLLKADNFEIQRFDMALNENVYNDVDNKINNNTRLDVRVEEDTFLKLKPDNPDKLTPIFKLDNAFKNILGQMNDIPQFDKFLEIHEKKNQDHVRTNVEVDKNIENPEEDMKSLVQELRDVRKTSAGFSREISHWHLKTQIWSANIKVLTTMVGQASQGMKTLFRSAG